VPEFDKEENFFSAVVRACSIVFTSAMQELLKAHHSDLHPVEPFWRALDTMRSR
jgi:hypothetical protein